MQHRISIGNLRETQLKPSDAKRASCRLWFTFVDIFADYFGVGDKMWPTFVGECEQAFIPTYTCMQSRKYLRFCMHARSAETLRLSGVPAYNTL